METLYPTALVRVAALAGPHADLWLKNDGECHRVYGGNKIRKLERLLGEAEQRGARRILTFGAAGSHHVLATTLLARERGLPVAAVLWPQPSTAHVQNTLRAAIGAGLQAHPLQHWAALPWTLARVLRRGDYVIPVGGSNVLGTLGYVSAVGELVEQIRAGVAPEPDSIVVPLGSGGTAAGLLAGVIVHGLRARVVAVQVMNGRVNELVKYLAWQALRRLGAPTSWSRLSQQLEIERGFVGRGYGFVTPEAAAALRLGERCGIHTDPTYTAKTLAKALALVTEAAPREARRHILYWHTLSATPDVTLLEGAPAWADLPRSLRKLASRSADPSSLLR